jgi:hypothetical protein
MRRHATGPQIRHVRAHQIGDEFVDLLTRQGTDIVPFAGVAQDNNTVARGLFDDESRLPAG